MNPGEIGILNVGAGDTKLSFDKAKPAEVKRARAVVTDMLRRGFAILVEVGEKDGKPLYQRAESFDPKTDEYIIVGAPEDDAEIQKPPAKRTKGRPPRRRVAAADTRAVAVARSAGG